MPDLQRTGWSATASSTAGGTSSSNALDGNLNTYWASDPGGTLPQTLTVDMGAPQAIGYVHWRPAPGTTSISNPELVEVELSSDGVNWTSQGNMVWPSDARDQYFYFPIQTARYFRVTGLMRNQFTTTDQISCAEINAGTLQVGDPYKLYWKARPQTAFSTDPDPGHGHIDYLTAGTPGYDPPIVPGVPSTGADRGWSFNGLADYPEMVSGNFGLPPSYDGLTLLTISVVLEGAFQQSSAYQYCYEDYSIIDSPVNSQTVLDFFIHVPWWFSRVPRTLPRTALLWDPVQILSPLITLDDIPNLYMHELLDGSAFGVTSQTGDVNNVVVNDRYFLLTFSGIWPPPVPSCNNPPNGVRDVSYSHDLTVTGGSPPYTFFVIAGALPPGLSLDASTGIISGIPTTAGTYNFSIGVVGS